MIDNLTYKNFEDVPKALDFASRQSEEYWMEVGFANGAKVFSLMYEKLPAYREFLSSKGCKLQTVKNMQDFAQLPIITKKEYLQAHSYEDLLLGKPEDVKSFYMSSGSTGEPTIWPRFPEADAAYSVMVNFFYNVFWQIDRKRTLYISAVDLGIWASGNLQFHAAKYCSTRHKFTFANPGANYKYVYSIIKKLHSYYDLIIIATYPSVARKLLDYLLDKRDIDLKKLNIRFMLGGESHTIEWRYYVLEKIGLSQKDITGIMDYYGTSDSGGPGSATPLTTLIQNFCQEDKELCKSLFGQIMVPSLFQKNPLLHIESVNGKIIVTYPGQLPLCRYDSGDTGGVVSFERVVSTLKKYNYDLESSLYKYGFGKEYIWKWPFIYLTGRSDYAINIGGSVVYPKDIEGLFFKEETKIIRSFKLSVECDKDSNQKFVIYLELNQGIVKKEEEINLLSSNYLNLILDQLLKVNDDYAGAYDMDKNTCLPIIKIVPYNTYPFIDESERHKPTFIKKDT